MSRPASYYVTKDWSRFVPEGDPESAFGVEPADVERLGLQDRLDAFLTQPPTRPADKRRRFPDKPPSPVSDGGAPDSGDDTR